MDLQKYWPRIVRDLEEFQAIANAENVEIEDLNQSLQNLMNDQFITTATETGLARREAILKVRPYADDTLESRRGRIAFMWNNPIPYTDLMLLNRIELLVGEDGYEITRDYENYTLTILINLGVKRLLSEVDKGIRGMIPANLVFTLSLRYNRYEDLAQFTYDYLATKTYADVKDEVL